jgi:hypothetical protein
MKWTIQQTTSNSVKKWSAYTTEYFVQQKQQERERVKLAKLQVPKTNWADIVALYPLQTDIEYITHCFKEFCQYMTVILFSCLQSGFSKCGRVVIESCPFEIFDYWFGTAHINVKRTKTVQKVTEDGIKVCRRRFHYTWKEGTMPYLHQPYVWHTRLHKDGHGAFLADMHSIYIELKLSICETTRRVYCSYKQESQAGRGAN